MTLGIRDARVQMHVLNVTDVFELVCNVDNYKHFLRKPLLYPPALGGDSILNATSYSVKYLQYLCDFRIYSAFFISFLFFIPLCQHRMSKSYGSISFRFQIYSHIFLSTLAKEDSINFCKIRPFLSTT